MSMAVTKWAGAFGLSIIAALSMGLSASAIPSCDQACDLGKSLNLPITRWHDTDKQAQAIVVGVHGMTLYADAFNDLATDLASKGFDFYAADLRGFGRWRTASEKFGGDEKIHFGQSEDDLKRMLKVIRANNSEAKIYLLGESLGANIALSMAASQPSLVDGVIISAPCFKPEMHPSPRWAVAAVRGLAQPSKPMDMTPFISPYLTNDSKVSQACLEDKKICRDLSPMDLFKADKTNKEAIDTLSQLPNGMPILILAGENDKVMHSASIAKTVKKFGTENVSVHIIPNKGHLLLEHQVVDASISSIINNWLDKTQVALGVAPVSTSVAMAPDNLNQTHGVDLSSVEDTIRTLNTDAQKTQLSEDTLDRLSFK